MTSLAEAVSAARVALTIERTAYVQESLDLDDGDVMRMPRLSGLRELPDPVAATAQIAQMVLEVMTAVRPSHHLRTWVSDEVLTVATRRHRVASARLGGARALRPRTRVIRVRATVPADGVCEASVVVWDGLRVRAMALRLVGQDGRWVVHSMELG